MKIIAFIIRFFLARRYTIQLKGIDVLQSNQAKFILPNHQALIDPIIIYSHLIGRTKIVPVVTESFFKNPIFNYILKKFNAVKVSDLSAGNKDSSVLEAISTAVIGALSSGNSVLLYPSGQLAGQGYEKIFNKRGAWAIVNDLPENTQVIGVRITGLWGSMWSRAWIGKSPNFVTTLVKAIVYTLSNLIFFTPKRTVTIEFMDITDQAIQNAKISKNKFNDTLEQFYNLNGEEPTRFIKHHFLVSKSKRKLPNKIQGSVADLNQTTSFKENEIPTTIFEKVRSIISTETQLNSESISLNDNLNLNLNIDSLTLVLIISAIETEFSCISSAEVTSLKTVVDLCFIAMNKKIDHEELLPCFLHHSKSESKPIYIDPNTTITQLIVNTFSQSNTDYFAYDKIMGTKSRKEFLLKAMVVSKIIKKEVTGDYVGIMLPALQSTTLLVAATYLSGKIPVMLNWTVGPKVLEHCIEKSGVTTILTAKTFYKKIKENLTDSTKSKCIFFEEKVKSVGLTTKLSGLLSYYLKSVPTTKPEDVAVVLFTSGSESLPKAVALTHKNVLSDLHGSIEHMKFSTDKIFLSFLPPFHSFGFTILTVFPLISGLRIAYTPDPTDSREVLRILKHTEANTVLGTPTFLKMLLAIASDKDMKNVTLAVSGAESLHKSVIDLFKTKADPKAIILEGYGITECSPVLTINPLEKQKEKSVGTFIKGVSSLIVDINTNQPLETDKAGMILVKGDSIFNGYLDSQIDSPFVIVNNQSYYKTGDLGYIDSEGYLFITGRLKRFIKIAGEMISLPAIETVLLEKFGLPEKVVLAVEGIDKTETPQITLFTTIPLDITEVNTVLKQAGFSSLVKIHAMIEMEEIPLLGTGKTDYKMLKSKLE